MKKLLTAALFVTVFTTACNESKTSETPAAIDSTATEINDATEAQKRALEIADSTKMLDKKLADPNSNYSPDSLK